MAGSWVVHRGPVVGDQDLRIESMQQHWASDHVLKYRWFLNQHSGSFLVRVQGWIPDRGLSSFLSRCLGGFRRNFSV